MQCNIYLESDKTLKYTKTLQHHPSSKAPAPPVRPVIYPRVHPSRTRLKELKRNLKKTLFSLSLSLYLVRPPLIKH